MSRRDGSTLLAVGVAIAATGLLGAPALAAVPAARAAAVMSQVAGCSAGASHLLVNIVVDESASLRDTDPTDERATGVNAAIDVLAGLRATAEGTQEVEASLAVFAAGYTDVASWLPLTAVNAGRLKSISSDQLPARNRGEFTDYRAVFDGAREALEKRDAKVGGQSCKVLLWFTDGVMVVPGTDLGGAIAGLCGPGGSVDRARRAEIKVVAVALRQDDGVVTTGQRAQLKAVVEGAGEGVTCGEPAGGGVYLNAPDASALRRVFTAAAVVIKGGSRSPSVTCPSAHCADGAARLVVDRGTTSFQVLVDSPTDAATVTLTGPDGKRVRLAPGDSKFPWGHLEVADRGGLTSATASFDGPDGAQVGTWSVTSLTGAGKAAPVVVDLFHFWGAALSIEAPDGVLIGDASALTVRASLGDGHLPTDWYSSVDVQLQVDGVPVSLTPGDHGLLVGTLTLPVAAAQTRVRVTASATAVSKSGIGLAPVAAAVVLPARLAASYPTYSPTRFEVPTITTADGGVGILKLKGSENGPTKACLDAVEIAGPKNAGVISVSTKAQCVEIGPGEARNWTFTMIPKSVADGPVTGKLKIVLTGANAGDVVSVSVPVSSVMTRPVDEQLRGGIVAVLVALSALIPVLMLVSNTAPRTPLIADKSPLHR